MQKKRRRKSVESRNSSLNLRKKKSFFKINRTVFTVYDYNIKVCVLVLLQAVIMKKTELKFPYNLAERIGFYESNIWYIPYGTLTPEQMSRLEECISNLKDSKKPVLIFAIKLRMILLHPKGLLRCVYQQ